jgi:hypothetical protein
MLFTYSSAERNPGFQGFLDPGFRRSEGFMELFKGLHFFPYLRRGSVRAFAPAFGDSSPNDSGNVKKNGKAIKDFLIHIDEPSKKYLFS